jgi:hypothetical protein
MRSQAKNFVSYLEKSNARSSWLHHCRLLAGGSVPRMATPPRTQWKIQEKKTQPLKEDDARFGQLVTCDAFCRTGGGQWRTASYRCGRRRCAVVSRARGRTRHATTRARSVMAKEASSGDSCPVPCRAEPAAPSSTPSPVLLVLVLRRV